MSADLQSHFVVTHPDGMTCTPPAAIQAGLYHLADGEFFRQASRNLRQAHQVQGINLTGELTRAIGTTGCLEYDAMRSDGEAVRIRYVGYEQQASSRDELCEGYCRDRIAAAYRCLRWLETQHTDANWFPRVRLFDQNEGILAEGRGQLDGHTLLSEWIDGAFDIAVASELGVAVAKLHATPVTDFPIRGDREQEVSWWRQRQQYWGERLDIQELQNTVTETALPDMRCMVHLDLDPQNILIHDGHVSLTAFECASSIGDPALDVTVVLENCRNSGAATGQQTAADQAANAFVCAYQQQAGSCGADVMQRASRLIRSSR